MSYKDQITALDNERQEARKVGVDLLQARIDEKREWTAEEREKFDRSDRVVADSAGLIKQLIDQERNDSEAEIARAAYASIVRPEVAEQVDEQQREETNAFITFLRGSGPGNVAGNGKAWDLDFRAVREEKRIIRLGGGERELRTTLNVGTGSAGGTTVPTDLVRVIYDYMENVSGIRQAGATVITTQAGNNQDLPLITAHGSAAIVGEGTALAAADPAFGKVTLGAYKYGQLIQITHELLQDSGVDIIGYLGKDFGRGLGRATESHYVSGSGTNQPQGACLAAVAGTGVTLQTGATGVPSYKNLTTLVYSVENIYRDKGACFLMQDSFAGVIRGLTDGNGQPLWRAGFQYGLTGPQPDDLLGFPIYTTPFLSAVGTAAGTPMAFGNFTDGYVIRDAGTVRIERSDEFAFSTDLVTYRAIVRTDGKVRDQRAINVALAPTT